MSGPKILVIDIETMPAKVYSWGLFNQNHHIEQIIEPDRLICFAAKWRGEKRVYYYSEFHNDPHVMAVALARLLDEADVVVHFNGDKFDVPWIHRFLAEARAWHRSLDPDDQDLIEEVVHPSPFVSVDLYKVSKKFRWLSHKLAYITERFNLTGKLEHTGFRLWRDCDNGDVKMWRLMRRYNKQDVVTTEEVFDLFLPEITNLPAFGLYEDEDTNPDKDPLCPICSCVAQRRGFAYTKTRKYPRFFCTPCSKWFKGTRSERTVGAA